MSPDTFASKFAEEYVQNIQIDREAMDLNFSSCADNSRYISYRSALKNITIWGGNKIAKLY